MKFSDKLYDGVIDLWLEAVDKPFVKEMAEGTLDEDLFRNYMIQDYLYLLEYIDILGLIYDLAEGEDLRDFLQVVIKETENETYRVHLPHMRKMGVSDEEIDGTIRSKAISEYTGYMREKVKEHGLLAGLTALLQCSWLYAFIGKKAVAEKTDAISKSPYRFWFDAYTCTDYIDANQMWIDTVDRETKGISIDEEAQLTGIFMTCAGYENRLWDELWLRHLY